MIVWKGFADTPDGPDDYWHNTIIRELVSKLRIEPNLLITPGHFRDGAAVNEFIDGKPWIVWVLGDEEGDCPFWEVDAPIWRQFPNPHRPYMPDRILPLGYTPHTRPALEALGYPEHKKGWVLSGQNTNPRRKAAFVALERIDSSHIHPSPTFAGGIESAEYIKQLWEVEWAPCPAGNVRADSFRMWEALEAGAVPILDATTPAGDRNLWPDTLGTHPMPVVDDWNQVGGVLEQPAPLTETAVWYTRYKRDLVKTLERDWTALSGIELWDPPQVRLTTIITASPLPSHPSMDILAETVESVRARLSNEIVIAFDGPRDTDDKAKYEEHIRRVAWHANQYWPEVWIWYSGVWKHQAGTVIDVLNHVDSGALLMVEADTPLVGEIPWDELVALVYMGEFNSIRLHYDETIHPDHSYLMRGRSDRLIPVERTVQWSQRPHVALTQFYRDVLIQLPDTARTYIEDWVYGMVTASPWQHHKLGIYAPNGMKRSTHLDGRAGVPKGEFWFG